MVKIGKKIGLIMLGGAMVLSMINIPVKVNRVEAAEVEIRETDVTEASEGNVIVGIPGTYYSTAENDMLELMNEVRKEAYDEHLEYPKGSKKYLGIDYPYVPLKWSSALEKIASYRAAESCITVGHSRLTDKSVFMTVDGVRQNGEVIAWNSSVLNAIWNKNDPNDSGSWYSEKEYFINPDIPEDDQRYVQGHYIAMIEPKNKYVGISSFKATNGFGQYTSYLTIAGEFSTSSSSLSQTFNGFNGNVIQKVEVDADYVTMSIVGDNAIHIGESVTYDTEATITRGNNGTHKCKMFSAMKWSSSDPDIIEINENTGVAVAKKAGSAIVSVIVNSGTKTIKATSNVVVLPDGVYIESLVNPKQITVNTGTKPDLPETVKAKLSNNDYIDVKVEWEDLIDDYLNRNSYSYYQATTFDVKGTFQDLTVNQTIHVIPQIRSFELEYDSVTVDSGTKPTYPLALSITLTNNVYYSNQTLNWSDNNAYKNRIGGTYTAYGTFSFNTTKKAECELVVNPAKVTSVEYNENDITTPSGTEPVYPDIESVTWTNGDKDDSTNPGKEYGEIIWEQTDDFKEAYKNRDGGSYYIRGVYHDKINDVDWKNKTTVKVNVLPATITEVQYDDSDISVINGVNPTSKLPKTAKVSWSNGEESDENISWEAIPFENYHNMTGGEYTVKGSVLGTEVSVKYIVAAPVVEDIETFDEISTLEGVQPDLPESAEVTWNNGEITTDNIVWNEIDSSLLSKANSSFTVTGSLEGREGTQSVISISVKVEPKSLTDLYWSEEPDQTDFYDDYDWSKLNGTLLASYDNGTSEEISIKDDRIINDFDEDSTELSQEVTFSYSYENSKGKVTKTVKLPLALHIPKSLSIKPPTKTQYIEGQELDMTGFKAVTYYDDNTIKSHNGPAYNISGYDKKQIGDQQITVSQDGLKSSFTVSVIPKIATSINISSMPVQKIDVDLRLSGAEAEITYNDESVVKYSVSELVSKGDLIISGYDKSKQGKQTLEFTYNDLNSDYDSDIQTSSEIEIKDKLVDKVILSSEPTKTEYVEGLDMDLSGGRVTILYDNETKEENVALTDERVTVSGYDKNVIGEQTVTISIENKKTTFKVNVKEKSIVKISCSWPEKKEYLEGQDLELTGLSISINYDNNTVEEIDVAKEYKENTIGNRYILGFYDAENNKASMDKMAPGNYELSISYMSSYDDCSIVVKAPLQDAVASFDDSVNTDFEEGISDNEIIDAISGNVISVPCADGSTSEIVIAKEMISRPVTLSMADSSSDLSDEEKKMIIEASAENKEVKKIAIEISKDADDKPIYSYVYVKVAKTDVATPTPVVSATPTPVNGQPAESPEVKVTPTPEKDQDTQPSPSAHPDVQPTSTPSKDGTENKPVPGTKVNAGGASYTVQADNTVMYNGPLNKNITSAKIPDVVIIAGKSYPVTVIGKGAFQNCKKLKSIVIGNNVTTIGDNAFYKCTSLKSIVIPKKVKKIGKKAFYGCKKLKKITIKTTKLKKKTIGSKAFKGVYKKISFKCPKSKVKNYKKWIKKAGAPKKAKYKK